MRICPECKSKLKSSEILKSQFRKENFIKCSNCNTELVIRRTSFGIIDGITVIVGIFLGIYAYREFNEVYGILFSFILAVTLTFIIEMLASIIVTSIIGFKKKI